LIDFSIPAFLQKDLRHPITSHAATVATAARHRLTCLSALQGTVYLSADSADKTDAGHLYPTEFLNSMCPSGIAPHRLDIKAGMPLILLRNLDPAGGLADGTRLLAKVMQRNVLDCEISTGKHAGSRVFIPRILMQSSDTTLPFTLHRRQFPVRAAFAMIINKAQGQTLEFAGVYLPDPVFSQNQLYVAASRVGDPACIRFMVNGGKPHGVGGGLYTKNVVYKDVLI